MKSAYLKLACCYYIYSTLRSKETETSFCSLLVFEALFIILFQLGDQNGKNTKNKRVRKLIIESTEIMPWLRKSCCGVSNPRLDIYE